MDELKSKTRDAISRRDMQYQKEIGELRDMHQKQLQRVAGGAEMKQTQTETALKSEIERTEKTTSQQREVLKSNYEDQLKDRNLAFEEYTKDSLKKQGEARSGITERLTKAHDKEMKSVVADRDNQTLEAQREMRSVRHNADQKLKEADRGHESELERVNENHSITLRNASEDNQLTRDLARESTAEAMRRNRDRFEKATEKLAENSEKAREGLQGTVNGRLGGKLKALESENRKLKADIPRLEMKLGQQKKIEIQNVKDAMSDNIENLEKARSETVVASNRKTGSEMNKNNKTNEEILNRTHRFYQDKLSMEDMRAEERLG
ncbi:MAG: hypothetical protein EOP05_23350, partial [Proteobacteria bacterium]